MLERSPSGPEGSALTKVHVFLQPTGSIGKSAAASCLAQWYRTRGQSVLCAEFDPLQRQFLGLEGLQAHRVDFPRDLLGVAAIFDDLSESEQFKELLTLILKTDRAVIVDTGSASFFPLLKALAGEEVL